MLRGNTGSISEPKTSETEAPGPLSVAVSPNDADAVPALLEDITNGVHRWRKLRGGADEIKYAQARHDLLLEARTLVQALETPRETMSKTPWTAGLR